MGSNWALSYIANFDFNTDAINLFFIQQYTCPDPDQQMNY